MKKVKNIPLSLPPPSLQYCISLSSHAKRKNVFFLILPKRQLYVNFNILALQHHCFANLSLNP